MRPRVIAMTIQRAFPLPGVTTVLLAWLIAASCGGRAPKPQSFDCLETGACECRNTADCPQGLQCVNGRCLATPDSSVVLLGFGERCTQDSECESDRCIASSSGTYRICTRTCVGDCPPGWDCKRRIQDSETLCVQHLERLCAECSVDGHCHPAFGDYCLTLGGIQGCGRDCNYGGCPESYICESVPVGDTVARQCVPMVGSCSCTSESVGLRKSCSLSNQYGTCHGEAICQSDGQWSPCSAREPAPEICNGLDDNCSGLIDGDDPAVDISGLPTEPPYPLCRTGVGGVCEGRWTCQGGGPDGWGWVCAALYPSPEVCNGRDDDCDGQIDEDFRDEEGRYMHPSHCGSCSFDCETVLTHLATDAQGNPLPGAVTCELRGGSPTCVPQLCADGYAPWPEGQPALCLALVSPQCRPCTSASDCQLAVDRCGPVGDDPHDSCLQGCGTDALYGGCTGQVGQQGCCPQDHTCELVEDALVCLPSAGSCDCTPDRVGATRPCTIAGEGGTSCLGLQICEAWPQGLYGYGECDASTTVVEVCDGEDNDCNGVIDDPFIDQQGSGTYDVDEHCGACYANCLAMWSRKIQHAIGGCVYDGPSDTPHCEIVACTTETVGGGGTCQRSVDCPAGWVCHPDYHQCTRACSSPTACPGGVCLEGFCTIACTNNAQCTSQFGSPSACVGGSCQVTYQFHNVDEVESNGCECAAAQGAGVDRPDLYATYPEAGWPYVDRNCDGVDGDVASALFVWAGTASSQGTRTNPFRTIGEAITAFTPGTHTMVLVAEGYYAETIHLRTNLQLYGGYSPDFAERDVVLNPTIIAGQEPVFSHPNHPRGVVNAVNITTGRAVVAGFVIHGFDVNWHPPASQGGGSTYGIYIRDSSSSVVIANNVIVGGRGGAGGPVVAGSPGQPGGQGGTGRNSVECTNASCSGQSQPGGGAGTNSACSSAAGNPGAACVGGLQMQAYQFPLGRNGMGGEMGTYTSYSNPEWSYLCKYDCQVATDMDGDAAQSGNNGSAGGGASGCTGAYGQVVNGVWAGGAAAAGNVGTTGQGGGGGGAGGYVENINPTTCTVGNRVGDLGSTGGGGGAGGCGGTGGRGGGPGGGSFGIFVAYTFSVATTPGIFGNVVVRGTGGAGSAGGYGGHGGLGGQGGPGGISVPPAWCAGYAGKGGRGGDGGAGGGGGGGCGGVAWGLAGNQINAASYAAQNRFVSPGGTSTGGPGGLGGPSPAGGSSDGGAGLTGLSGDVHAY